MIPSPRDGQRLPPRAHDLAQSPIQVRLERKVHRTTARRALIVALVLMPITAAVLVWYFVDMLSDDGSHSTYIVLGLPVTFLVTGLLVSTVTALVYWPPFVRWRDAFAFDPSGYTSRGASVPWHELLAIRIVTGSHDHLELHVRDAHALRARLRRWFRVLVEPGQGRTGVFRQRLDGIVVEADVEAMLPRLAHEAAARGLRFDVVHER